MALRLSSFYLAALLALMFWGAVNPVAKAQSFPPRAIEDLLKNRSGTIDRQQFDRKRRNERPSQEERLRETDERGLPKTEEFEPLSHIERDYNRRLGHKLPDELEEERRRERKLRREKLLATGQIEVEQFLSEEDQLKDQLEEMPRIPYLRQYGYDLFKDLSEPLELITGRVAEDYILGVGDEVLVSLVGSISGTFTTLIDSEGRVVVDQIPPVPAAGRRFGEFREDMERRIAESLLGTQGYVSVGALRQINVSVLGEVSKPGVYYMTSQSDLLEALAKAGGIKKSGSLRNILVRDSDGVRSVDLYDLLNGNADTNLNIRDGAIVRIPLIGQTVAVAGDVVRPAIYELPPDRALDTRGLLSVAGGAIRPRGYIIERNRVDDDGRQRIDVASAGQPVSSGDLFQIYPKRELQVGQVYLDGHVRQKGARSLTEAPTLSALIKGGDALKPSPYTPFAILEGVDEQSHQRVLRPVNLSLIMNGVEDIPLSDQDKLIVLGDKDLQYLSSEVVRGAILSPEDVSRNQCSSIRELSKRVKQADGERLAAVARSVFVAEGEEEPRGERRTPVREEREDDRRTQDAVSTSELSSQAGFREDCNVFFEEFPHLLSFSIEHAAVLMGALRRPGLYPVARSASLRNLVLGAGGLNLTTDVRRIEVSSLHANVLSSPSSGNVRYVDLNETPLTTVDIHSGDVIRFVSHTASLEVGTVLLSGEFRHPGIYTISKGETLLDIIERAGGITDQAYPYGAVFTRLSVKREQEESFRRTARELNNALALALLQEDVSGDAIAAATELIGSFANVEAVGRIVVDADPESLRRSEQANILLESGDALHMPKRPNYILTAGDLLNPGALKFDAEKRLEDYLDESGGLQRTADEDRVFVVYPNGEARPVVLSGWSRASVKMPPGTTIVVPKDVNPLETLNIVREISALVSDLAISAASISVISR